MMKPEHLNREPAVDFTAMYDLVWIRHVRPVVAVAQSLGWFEAWATAPNTIAEAAKKFEVSLRSAEAIMAVLAAAGYLSRDDEGRYAITPVTREYLLESSPFYWGLVLPPDNKTLADLRQAVSTGEPVVPVAITLGTSEDAILTDFINDMHRLTLAAGIHLTKKPVFSEIRSLLDIAGGSGSLACAIAAHNPEFTATILDLPRVADIAQANIQSYELSERISTTRANMLEDDWPSGHDAILMGNIFHDWDVDTCRTLAQRAFDALPSGGKILLHEMVLNETRDGPLSVACFSISMLLHERGKQYTPSEFSDMLTGAGFEDVVIDPAYGYYSLVSATKPQPSSRTRIRGSGSLD